MRPWVCPLCKNASRRYLWEVTEKGKAMATETDLIKLYSQRILALAADIPHRGRLDAPEPQASVRKRAPLCGSTVTVDLDVENGVITRFGQDVKACAQGQARTSSGGPGWRSKRRATGCVRC